MIVKDEFLSRLRKIFNRRGFDTGLAVFDEKIELDVKIEKLFRTVFKEHEFILFFDDFEQNLVSLGEEYVVGQDYLPIVRAILNAIDWAEGKTNVIITSRYAFMLEHEGEDLTKKLEDISLMSMRASDLTKKKAELLAISKSKHEALYMKYGCGNPRLLEWLEVIAKEESKYDIESLKAELEGKSEEFISEYLAEILARAEGSEFERFLQKSSVFRSPVPVDAYRAFGSDEQLERGVNITLFEKERVPVGDAVYWVTPVIRQSQWDKVVKEEQKRLHKEAYDWYDKRLGVMEEPDYGYLEEAVYHSLESGNVRGACRHAVPLGQYMTDMLLYRERAQMQEKVAKGITEDVKAGAIRDKDDRVAVLLNEVGVAWRALGEAHKAIEYYEQALEIDLKVFGNVHPNVATYYNNIGEAWRALGEARKAIEYMEQALEIVKRVYGENHPDTKLYKSNLELARQSSTGSGKKSGSMFGGLIKKLFGK